MEATVLVMADTLRHRGPDDRGAWADPAAGIALGHRRLSVVDLSPLGHQPMLSACGRYVITFNGEVYNFRLLRAELEEKGHAFRGRSDTEVMLAAVRQWGLESAVRRFVGMFAFALWDREERRLHLVRDRLGIKPLYYGWCNGVFLFGSELKALRAHPRFEAPVDRGALTLYLRYGFVPAPHSIHAGIRKLPPGCIVSLDSSTRPGTEKPPAPYWSLREVLESGRDFVGSDEEAANEFDARLHDAVKLRMEADVPLGAFLSGGVDSSLVVALMQAQSARPVRTFTIGFQEEAFNEAEDARRVARHLGTEHVELYVEPSHALEVVPRLAEWYDEPFADSSQLPTALLCEMTRRHVTVALSGDGGDELFAGYERYDWARRIVRTFGGIPDGLRGGVARAILAIPPAVIDALARLVPRRLVPSLPGDKLHKLAEGIVADGASARGFESLVYLRLLTLWENPDRIVSGAREPHGILDDPAVALLVPDFVPRLQYLDLHLYLPDDILTKVDRASMAFALEARVPLLDHRVVEFAWMLPFAMKVRGNERKWLIRRVLDRYVPRELVERPKRGFGVPIDSWLRGPLRDWAESLLDERRLREGGMLDPAPVRDRWAEHLSGRRGWHYSLWAVLMFQAWRERWGS